MHFNVFPGELIFTRISTHFERPASAADLLLHVHADACICIHMHCNASRCTQLYQMHTDASICIVMHDYASRYTSAASMYRHGNAARWNATGV